MNQPPLLTRRRWWCHPLILGPLLLMGLLVVVAGVVLWSFLPGRSITRTREAIMQAVPGEWSSRFGIAVGRVPTALVRVGLAFASLPPEARAALSSFRCGEVSLAKRKGRSDGEITGVLKAVDREMSARDWERVVCVMDGGELVAVYTSRDGGARRGAPLRCSVVVLAEDGQLVVASMEAGVEPWMDLIRRNTGIGGSSGSLASRRLALAAGE